MSENKTSELALGNNALRERRYEEAIHHYKKALSSPDIGRIVAFNLNFAMRKYRDLHGKPYVEKRSATLTNECASIIAAHFDSDFYLAQYPDVAKVGVNPLEHYCEVGWKEMRDPHPNFSTAYYLNSNPDVAEAGINPYRHYIVAGRVEGRLSRQEIICEPAISESDEVSSKKDKAISVDGDGERGEASKKWKGWAKQIRPHFDKDYYLAQYPDIAAGKIDPVKHYCIYGWKEGRNPHPDFSTIYYLEANPDVAEAGINPYWHYVIAGRREGRTAQHPGGYKAEVLKSMLPLEDVVKLWVKKESPPAVLNADQLFSKISSSLDNGISRLIVSVGHDHYKKISGGVQLCIQREEEAAKQFDALYLNVHPWQPLPRLAKHEDDPDPLVCLVLNGADIGHSRMSVLIATLRRHAELFEDSFVVIHSLLGHMPEMITQLVQATDKKSCWIWLHDFFTLCPSYALQRNTITYCGAPMQTSNACNLCVFGKERPSHRQRIKALFESLDAHVISPSEITRDLWEQKIDAPFKSVTVAPHMQLSWISRETRYEAASTDVITVGFIGAPVPHKGWPVFQQLVAEFGESKHYRFVYFGNHKIALSGVESFNVHVTSENYAAMIEAIAKHNVDIVLHWATCRETFSFSTYEALAGGAYVITNPDSGNVSETIQRLGRGAVLADVRELVDFFNSGRAMQLALESRRIKREYEIRHSLSEMSIPLLTKGAE